MKNPFRYAEIVIKDDFADREEEIKELVLDLESGQKYIFYILHADTERLRHVRILWR